MAFTFNDFKNKLSEKQNDLKISIHPTWNGENNPCIWISYNGINATERCHYEFNADGGGGKAKHQNNRIYVEVHFEDTNWKSFEKKIEKNGLFSFPWVNETRGIRIDVDGVDMNVDVNDAIDDAIKKLKELDEKVGKIIKQTMTEITIKEIKDLLEKKKNIILQGAPGVGKTYTTAALALSICGVTDVELNKHSDVMKRYEQLQKEGRIGFVTFHQSMDYEDFVEGIKPQIIDEDTMIYKVEDGIFKKIANKANKNLEDSKKTEEQLNAEEHARIVFNMFCNTIQKQLDEEGPVDLSDKTTLKIRKIKYKDEVPFAIQLARVDSKVCQTLTFDIVQRDYHNYKEGEIKSYTDIAPRYESKSTYHGNANYYFALFEKMSKYDNTPTTSSKVVKQNYVLIIDEINRGNVSKIFGELITLLEADKRIDGKHPIKLTLPYSKKEFGVPSNLYIIGTMNTTDRSVGNIDYAVRRRFAFVTLKADVDVLIKKYGKDSIQVKLFNAVNEFVDTNNANELDLEDLKVGHSFFMVDTKEDLQRNLKYEIIPLIKEYIKDGLLKSEGVETEITKWNKIINNEK